MLYFNIFNIFLPLQVHFYLTLTNVVFEYRLNFDMSLFILNLTLTNVVFEYCK